MNDIPVKIVVGPDQVFSVEQTGLNGPLGCYDRGRDRILIEVNQHPAGKHEILLHEMIHVVCEKIKAAGLAKRQPSEEFITYLAGGLFPMLACSGLWNGVSPEEAMQWVMEEEEDERPASKP